MTILLKSKQLLETKITEIDLPIAFDSVDFDVEQLPFLAAMFIPRKPDNAGYGNNDYFREIISFVVLVNCQLNTGSGEALEIAESVRSKFKRGTTLEEDGIRVNILSVPQISTPIQLVDRLVVSVTIPALAENLN